MSVDFVDMALSVWLCCFVVDIVYDFVDMVYDFVDMVYDFVDMVYDFVI
uniref:Uncharacterized protein n=1 Tax=Chionoecetes opilio bacilliform virus TaxID=1825681 RepID=A0A1Q3DL20_9VIRU|nr:hypothetical protein SCV_080 [Chionoecetes opilio bacilliform virus]